MWMEYNIITESSFILEMIVQLVLLFVLQSSLYTLSFIVAESLTRKAFPNQLQFWKLWSKDVAPSVNVLGQTLAGTPRLEYSCFMLLHFTHLLQRTLGGGQRIQTIIQICWQLISRG